MSHSHRGRLTPWTFGYTPGTRSECLVCGDPIVWTVGPKRMFWRVDKTIYNTCSECGRQWLAEHHCRGAA